MFVAPRATRREAYFPRGGESPENKRNDGRARAVCARALRGIVPSVFCPACGTQLPETAKFCLECGVKLSTFAPGVHPDAAGGRTAPVGTPAIVPATSSSAAPDTAPPSSAPRHETSARAEALTPHPNTSTPQVYVDPGDDRVVLPMSGPSKRTLALGAAGIATVSLLIGAVGAWRAVKASRPESTPAPPLVEPMVALIETPQPLPHSESSEALRRGVGSRGQGTSSAGSSGARDTRHRDNERDDGDSSSGAGSRGPTTGTGGRAGTDAPTNSNRPSGAQSASGPSASGRGGSTGSGATNSGATSSGSSGSASGGATNSGASSGDNAGTNGASVEGSGMRGPRAPSSGGFVEGDSTDATGTLSPSAFTFVYRHYRAQIASCHSMVTRGGQEVSGILRVRVRIGTDGHVVRTRVLENSTRNETLATCVQNQIRTWRYPQPEGGEVEVDYPFGFGN